MRSAAHMAPSTTIDRLNYIHSTYHCHVSLLDKSIFLGFSQRPFLRMLYAANAV